MVREGVRESLADLFRQSLTAKGGNRGCWSGCYGRSAAENITDRRASTAVFVDTRTGRTVESGSIGPDDIGLHRPEAHQHISQRFAFIGHIGLP